MDGPSRTVSQHACGLTELKQVRDCENVQLRSSPTLRPCCRKTLECTAMDSQLENAIQKHKYESNRKPHGIVIYKDGSVNRNRST